MKKDDDFFKQFRSPIPPHLTPEEVEEWEKEMKWQKEEKERIRKSGGYDQVKPRKRRGRLTAKIANLLGI